VTATRHGLDPHFYFSDDVFQRERERVFGRSWIPVCREEEVATPGDYVTYDLAGDPIVITRSRDGRLHALANVCRHRSMVIMEGAGNAPALQCPYHHWTYALDGSLTGAPYAIGERGIDGFDRTEHCLPRLALECWQGFVLVNVDADAPPLGPQLAALDDRLERHRMAEMVRVGSITWEQRWNWKLTFENYAESYHHIGIHPTSLQPMFPGERSAPVTGGLA
jgi:phenylpropionate dioxygenase-like ring-hydroxylating dioxygenase large terminal subunit